MNPQNQTYRVVMAAGGTGGHIYPAIAIAHGIRELVPGADVRFAGTRTHMEWTAVPEAGYPIDSIWISGFQRRLTPENLLFPVKLITSLFQSWNILRRVRPHAVVCCGGYVAGPVGYVAAKMGIPLILQEQNSYPGVTNRLLGKHATLVFTAFNDANLYFPKDRVRLEGNPIRTDLLEGNRQRAAENMELDPHRKTLTIMGGSGGAKAINDAVRGCLDELHHKHELQIIWQCGKRYYEAIRAGLNENEYPNLRLRAFLDDMPGIYALSDLVVCRAGASTISELMATATPSLLIPSPNVAGDHQRKNAIAVVSKGAADMLTDDKLDEKLAARIHHLMGSELNLAEMQTNARKLGKPEAQLRIAQAILRRSHPHPETLNLPDPDHE
ncbi:MAG: UDP-N-acetylglucosamine--N-acetylmuramyl-(pentapeptide) pyrophosphoryl-undecaprenol N-acetylglucosam [Bacteroidetes bacterium HLUCCA01]|nr:MAG: UDP-N-acetylglucosamine--N-acetylmuramyl-(pentapeptide) pyrophosphoryl-undecaprenol N-acetylglucosam [Bacteroidetes bacterium HLUCCA01]